MASFYLRVRNQLASKNRGGGHADYIAGQGYYQNKNEVAGVIDKNLPAFAKDFKEFLEAADKNERANGRSYRSLIIAIPKEAGDKMAWASEYADKLLGDAHAYRLAFHNDEGNPHLHLTFSERPSTSDSLKFEPWKYFSRKNPKDRTMSEKRWLVEAKELYLDHIRKVCPDFSPSKNCGEVKIGPKLAGASEQYEAGRLEREAKVKELRQLKTEFKDLDLQINAKPAARPSPRFKSILENTLIRSRPIIAAHSAPKSNTPKPKNIELDENGQVVVCEVPHEAGQCPIAQSVGKAISQEAPKTAAWLMWMGSSENSAKINQVLAGVANYCLELVQMANFGRGIEDRFESAQQITEHFYAGANEADQKKSTLLCLKKFLTMNKKPELDEVIPFVQAQVRPQNLRRPALRPPGFDVDRY